MNVKTIIVDLDKTLLRSDRTVSPYTAKILGECKKNGIRIMVATARPQRDALQFCSSVDFDAMTATNGARVICDGKMAEYGIRKDSVKKLLFKLAHHPSLRISLETGDRAYSNKAVEEYETVISDDLAAIAETEGILKLLVHLDRDDTLETVKKELSRDLYYTVATGYLMQIMDRSATKWNGIKAMLEISNCKASETLYFGDDYDDVEPLRMCGIGVAVSNGIDEAKAAADYITQSNDADGVVRFIERMILKRG